ncbi:MAG: zinc ABC transporter substrate-binding protein [Acidocella sp.]|nr:zinc ABC transporter substrate-binding protein [Acidocella sp.]MDE8349917.1 zinc ABC transporter substrate-binding protein [Acidocella sp.]
MRLWPASPQKRRAYACMLAVLSIASVQRPALAQTPTPEMIKAVGVESQYADVISQVGGQYVQVSAIETDPNTDPHSFEASPKIVAQIAAADLVVENGLGYDDWADKMLAATPSATRLVINVQQLRGLVDSTQNPHLWYDPATMPAVAKALVADLAALQPAHAAYFQANAARFDAALKPWLTALAAFKADFPDTQVAVTEPVGDYLLQAAGADILTPFGLQAAIMNGTDPSPQDVTTQNALFTGDKVKIFIYNQQVTDPLTESFLSLAKRNGIPIVAVYETMPAPGYHYQSWMLAEVVALRKAVTDKVSTATLLVKPQP